MLLLDSDAARPTLDLASAVGPSAPRPLIVVLRLHRPAFLAGNPFSPVGLHIPDDELANDARRSIAAATIEADLSEAVQLELVHVRISVTARRLLSGRDFAAVVIGATDSRRGRRESQRLAAEVDTGGHAVHRLVAPQRPGLAPATGAIVVDGR